MLARLSEKPRMVGAEVQERLDFVRAMRVSLPTSLGVMLGGMALGIVFAAASLPIVTLPCMLLSVGGFLLTPFQKRKQMREVYANGEVTRGRILQARNENGALVVTYVFRHEDREHRGMLLSRDPFILNRVEPDTPVLVFFDPAQPKRNAGLLPDELPKDLRDPPAPA